jgi:hypothetical protein
MLFVHGHKRIIILKARQIDFSTLLGVVRCDQLCFNPGQQISKYAALTYYHLDVQQPLCGTIHNLVSPEMLFCASSTGEDFDERSRKLRKLPPLLCVPAYSTEALASSKRLYLTQTSPVFLRRQQFLLPHEDSL